MKKTDGLVEMARKNRDKKKAPKKAQKKKGLTKEPFFARMGKFVSKNYKWLLIAWVILVGCSIYPAIRLSGVLSYNEMEFLPENLEYHKGQELYEELFPTNATDNTIIVIDSDVPITANENMEYIEELVSRIKTQYGEDIYSIQSVLSILEQFNNTYWSFLNSTIEEFRPNLKNNASFINEYMWDEKAFLENTWQTINSLFTHSWFNISRGYYYGLFNSTLFYSGPTPENIAAIQYFTGFETNQNLTEDIINQIYSLVNTSVIDPQIVNDTVLHLMTYNFVNTTLFTEFNSSQNMTYPTYETIILPYLDLYMANWTETFYDNITVYDNQIINGTAFSENQFENISLSLAHSSQEDVWNILMNINSTAASNINFTQIIIKNATDFLDVSSFYSEYIDLIGLNPAEVEEAIQPLISVFIANIYTLGPEPTQQAIENVVNEFIEQLIDLINTFYCPPSSIDEVPNLFTRFVLSPDKRTSLILIQYNSFNKTIDEKEQMVKTIDQEIGELAHSLAEEMGLNQTRIYHTGDEYVFEVWVTQAQEDAKLIDIFTIVFVLIILLVIFCSLIEPLIPLAVIGGSISISMALIYFISFAMDIHFLSTLFLTVTSLGAGVDYCIFLLARYNEERKKGKDKFEAVEISTKYAGESVFHSSLTVMVGFGALIIPNFPLLRILGISMIIGIFISIISANLIVPSILLVLGDIIWWPEILQIILRPQKWFKRKKQDDKDKQEGKKARPDGQPIEKTRNDKKNNEKADEKSFLIKFSHFVTNNGLIITLATLLVASPFVYFMFNMETSTDIMGMLSKDFEGTEGRDILSAQLSIGDPTPIKILFTDLEEHPMENNVLKDTLFLSDYIKRQNNDDQRGHNAEVTTVLTTVQPLGLPLAYENPQSRTFFEEQMLRFIGNNNRSFIVEIYLDKDPFDSNTLVFLENLPDLIENSITKANLTTLQSSEIHYLGIAQNLYEIKNVTDTAYPIVISVVIVGVYLVLFFLFGSYFTPIRLIFTIALSIAFTLGLLQLVFSVGFNVPIFWLLPLMLFSILMGLGLDYDIFLVTRIKEYHDKGLSNKTAIAHALDHTATIITSCGILMAAAYSTLFLSNLWHLRELGFAFALAIILDATVVRIIIVPAMMVLLEKYNWVGPKWLQRFGNQNQEHPEKKINSKEKKQT